MAEDFQLTFANHVETILARLGGRLGPGFAVGEKSEKEIGE